MLNAVGVHMQFMTWLLLSADDTQLTTPTPLHNGCLKPYCI
jgi:hypothetical protein